MSKRLRSSLALKLGALLAFAVLAIAACGGNSASKSGGNKNLFSGDNSTAAAGLDIRPAPKGDKSNPDADAGTPKRGGKVTISLQAEDDNGYCLAEAQLDAAGEQVAGSIYDTLVRPTNDGKFAPYLAEKVDHSADYKTWTLTLRSGIKFSDGSALDATVVKNNLDAYRGKNPNRKALLFLFVFDNIADVKATGPLTVEVDMKKPWRDFESYLYADRRLGMMGQAQIDDVNGCAKNLIGTGPFKLESWTVGQKYVLKPNPNYWRKGADGKPLPYLDELDYVPILDSNAQLNAFEGGQTNVIMTSTAESVVKLRQLAAQKKATLITSVRADELGYLMLNAAKPPFDDQTMRLAAAEAVDYEQINRDIGRNVTPLTSQPFAPGNIAYNDAIKRIGYNPADAQKLVAAYTQTHGKPKVVITATTDPITAKTAAVIQNYLTKAGFDASVATIDQAQLISGAIAGNFQIQTWRNHNGADPGEQYVWWHTGYPTNFGHIDDPIIDCLLDVGRSGQSEAQCLQDPKLNQEYNTNLPQGFKDLKDISPDDLAEIYSAISVEFNKKVWNIWGGYSPWSFGTAPNVHGIFGLDSPDGSHRALQLVNGTPTESMWVG